MTSRINRRVQAMHGYVPGEQPASDDVVKLNTNENPYPPSPCVGQALDALNPEQLRKYSDPMCVELRTAVAGLHDRTMDDVIIGNGSDEILALCTRAFLEDDQAIGYFEPSYSLYPVLAEIRGSETAEIPLSDDFAWPEESSFTGAAWERCGLFYITNPNAPTGTLYSADSVERFAERFSGVVVVDEAYVDFASSNCLSLLDRCSNVIIARTLSKSYSLAGLRCGYALGAPDLIEALHKIKDAYNVDSLTQALAAAAISDQEHFRHHIDRVIATRERLSGELSRRGFDVHPSESNFVWTRPPGVAAADLFEQLKQRHIYVRIFKGPRLSDYLRITVGTDGEIDTLLAAMDEILA